MTVDDEEQFDGEVHEEQEQVDEEMYEEWFDKKKALDVLRQSVDKPDGPDEDKLDTKLKALDNQIAERLKVVMQENLETQTRTLQDLLAEKVVTQTEMFQDLMAEKLETQMKTLQDLMAKKLETQTEMIQGMLAKLTEMDFDIPSSDL